jgi:hypothetical protein
MTQVGSSAQTTGATRTRFLEEDEAQDGVCDESSSSRRMETAVQVQSGVRFGETDTAPTDSGQDMDGVPGIVGAAHMEHDKHEHMCADSAAKTLNATASPSTTHMEACASWDGAAPTQTRDDSPGHSKSKPHVGSAAQEQDGQQAERLQSMNTVTNVTWLAPETTHAGTMPSTQAATDAADTKMVNTDGTAKRARTRSSRRTPSAPRTDAQSDVMAPEAPHAPGDKSSRVRRSATAESRVPCNV